MTAPGRSTTVEQALVSRWQSVAARIWASGVLQGVAVDALIVVGLVAMGVGIGQVSVAGLWIYAGFVMVVVGLLVASLSVRRAPPPQRGES